MKNAVKFPSILVFLINMFIIPFKTIYGLMEVDILLEDISRELIHQNQNAHKYGKGRLFTEIMDRKMLNSCYVQLLFKTHQA